MLIKALSFPEKESLAGLISGQTGNENAVDGRAGEGRCLLPKLLLRARQCHPVSLTVFERDDVVNINNQRTKCHIPTRELPGWDGNRVHG